MLGRFFAYENIWSNVLGCFFAYENIWLNVNLNAFLLLEISGGMLLRWFFV